MPYPIHFPLTLSKFPFPHVRLSWSSFPVCFTLAGLGACSRGALCQNKHTRFHLLGQRLCTHFLQRLAFSLPLPQSLEFCLIPSFPSLSGFHTTIRNGSQRMSELPSLSEIRLYYAIKLKFKLAWREGSINISLGQMKDYILLY